MKNSFFLVVLVCALFTFNSCSKDKEVSLAEQEIIENTESNNTRQRTCGLHNHMNKLNADPEYRKAHEAKLAKVKNMAGNRSQCSTPVVLPMAVHFQGVTNPDLACLRQLAQSQIDILNADYGGSNSDITNWTNNAASFFPGVSNGETCIQFCLADQNHPNGFNLSNGEPAVTVNQTTGDFNADWSGYLNIFVQFNTGVLGYSPLGGSGNGDGVVIDASAFGSGSGCGQIAPQSPYNLGRTLTHELGHYLLLDHIWGGGCSQDDDVADTPNSADAYYGCPNVGESSCSSTDMHMNYMDYTNDACMYMFSDGQSTRMENYVTSSLSNLSNNTSNVCSGNTGGGGNTPTCNDGIQNGQETGVDCGGPDCQPCQTVPTCNDGVQNGQETGVDCGGPDCQPCQTQGGCEKPTNLNVNVASATTAIVTFSGVPDAIEYRVQYKIQGGSFTTLTTTDTYTILDGLQGATTYIVRVRSVCADENSPFTTTEFTTPHDDGNCDCNGALLDFSLTLDNYPSETAWQITADNGAIIAEGNDYNTAGETIENEICFEDGCYSFFISDSFGDGICCDYGNGSFSFTDADGNVVANGGEFGDFEAIDFCVNNGQVDVIEFRKKDKDFIELGQKSKPAIQSQN